MSLVTNTEQRAIDRLEDLEDMEYQERIEDKRRKHEVAVLKEKRRLQGKYRTIRDVLLTLVKLPAVCLVVLVVGFLLMIKREVPESLTKLLNF